MISFVCLSGFVLIIPLIWYEYKTLQQFSALSDNKQSTKERLTGMLTFLRSRSFITLLSTSSTYLFGFNAAMLLYFFAGYGELREMRSLDFLVFPTICFLGIIITYIQNNNTIKFQIKHLELSLSDLDKDVLPMVSRSIEAQQKKERTTNLLVGTIVLLSFLLLVFVLKVLGV